MAGSTKLSELEANTRKLQAERRVLATGYQGESPDTANATLANAIQFLNTLLRLTERLVARYQEIREERETEVRKQLARAGLDRPVSTPDQFPVFMTLIVTTTIEASFNAALLAANGFMGLVGAVLMGAVLAITTTFTAIMGGLYGLRYARKRFFAFDRALADRLINMAGVAGFLLSAMAIALMIFAAARLRLTGSMAGIFDFSAAGFGSTFDDIATLALVIVGCCSAVISYACGYCGLKDPEPGLSEAQHWATSQLDAEAEAGISDVLDQLEEAVEGALETAQDAEADYAEYQQECRSLLADHLDGCAAHEHAIDAEIDARKRADEVRRKTFEAIYRRKAPDVDLGLEALNSLRLPPYQKTRQKHDQKLAEQFAQLTQLKSDLLAEADEAELTIRAALIEYRTSGRGLTPFYEKESEI